MAAEKDNSMKETLLHLGAVTKKLKELRSLVNEMWAMPAKGTGELDEAVHLELDRLTDCTESIISGYQAHISDNQEEARKIISEVNILAVKAASAALDKIAEEMRSEADEALRFHYIRRGDWALALDARSEGRTLLKDARKLWEKDDDDAVESYRNSIEAFEKAATSGKLGGRDIITPLLILLPFLVALISLTPLGDSIKLWVGEFTNWLWNKIF